MPRPLLQVAVPALRLRVEIDDDETGPRPIVREPVTRLGRFAQVLSLLDDALGRDAAAREASRVVRMLPRSR